MHFGHPLLEPYKLGHTLKFFPFIFICQKATIVKILFLNIYAALPYKGKLIFLLFGFIYVFTPILVIYTKDLPVFLVCIFRDMLNSITK